MPIRLVTIRDADGNSVHYDAAGPSEADALTAAYSAHSDNTFDTREMIGEPVEIFVTEFPE